MSTYQPKTLRERLQHLDRREHQNLIRNMEAINAKFADLASDLGDAPGVQEKLQLMVRELGDQLNTLRLVVDEINEDFADFGSAMDGFMDILFNLGEHKINSICLLPLLAPLYRQFTGANSEYNTRLVG